MSNPASFQRWTNQFATIQPGSLTFPQNKGGGPPDPPLPFGLDMGLQELFQAPAGLCPALGTGQPAAPGDAH